MSDVGIGLSGLAALIALIAVRVPIGIALIGVSFGGLYILMGPRIAWGAISIVPYQFTSSWILSSIPMFLFLGFISYHTQLTRGMFNAARIWLSGLPGGLAIASIFGSAGFAAVSGSSIACSAAMGRIAIPEMMKYKYHPELATGTVAVAGTIGALIPPSILMIVYGVFAETSVTRVFMGGISIGLMTALSYVVVVLVLAWLRPDVVPRKPIEDETLSAGEALKRTWPVLLLIGIVFGGLFSGLFTATEAGAVGALGAILCAALVGNLTREVMRKALLETLMTSASLFIIGIGAAMFTRFLGITGLSGFIAGQVSGAELSYWHLMLIIVLVYVILGMFMEPFGAMLITLPVFLPILNAEQISLIWFGVVVVKLLEIGMITPPVGLNVFVIRNVAQRHATLMQIFRGVTPFLAADLVVLVAVLAFPGLVLFLPGLL